MFEISCATCSDAGARERNEDDLRCGRVGDVWYAVVADGAGGHSRGAEASRRAVLQLESRLQDPDAVDTPAGLTGAVRAAHAEVLDGQPAEAPHAQRMMTTVVALRLDAARGEALWSHVGDSRLYRFRQGRVDFVTRDDSVAQRMFDAGLLSSEQLRGHPYRNQLVAALGMPDTLEPHTPASADAVHEGDAYLLCTDGWWATLDDRDLPETLNNADDPKHWLHLMRERILGRGLPRQDNFSAIALWVGDPWASRFLDDADLADTRPQ